MLSDYLNQTVVLTPADRNEDGSAKMNNRGEIEYLSPVSVSCRRLRKTQEILTPDKQIIKTTLVYYLDRTVRVDDLLDGFRVQDVGEWADLMGDTIGYKAVV